MCAKWLRINSSDCHMIRAMKDADLFILLWLDHLQAVMFSNITRGLCLVVNNCNHPEGISLQNIFTYRLSFRIPYAKHQRNANMILRITVTNSDLLYASFILVHTKEEKDYTWPEALCVHILFLKTRVCLAVFCLTWLCCCRLFRLLFSSWISFV